MDKRRGRRRSFSPDVFETVAVLFVIVLVVGGGLVGWLVGRENGRSSVSAVGAASTAPPGHLGENVPVGAFGSATVGARLWDSKSCGDCHSIAGTGGTDAPALDYMRGHVSAREIADMSGQIWNHVPMMVDHFKEEGIPFPAFAPGEMADLVAFLHDPAAAETGGSTGGSGGMSH